MLDVADELLAPAHVRHDPALEFDAIGIDEIKTQVSALRAAFPDLRFEASIYASSDDDGFVTRRWTMTGTAPSTWTTPARR